MTVARIAAALSRMPLSNVAAAILEASTEFFVSVVVRSPGCGLAPVRRTLRRLLALLLLLLARRLLLLTLLLLLLWR